MMMLAMQTTVSDAPGRIFLLLIGALIYLIPWIVSLGKPQSVSVFFLNLFLGWTFVGWVVALVWAVAKPQQVVIQYQPQPATQMGPFCRQCGSPAAGTGRFCISCGSAMTVNG